MKADAKTEAAAKAVLQKVADGYARRDMDLVRAAFARDPDVVMFGTGAHEKRIGLKQIEAQVERDWSQSDSTAIRYGWVSVSAAGTVAWVATDASFEVKAGGQQATLPVCATFVLEMRGEDWLIVQGHFSFAAAGEAEGKSFPAQ
jgi:hypothetical protein